MKIAYSQFCINPIRLNKICWGVNLTMLRLPLSLLCELYITTIQGLTYCMIITLYCLFICRYIRPQFFYNNPLLSFIQFVIGPYTDDLGNVLPYAVEGVGVPVDPLAFAGLLGEFLVSLPVERNEYASLHIFYNQESSINLLL